MLDAPVSGGEEGAIKGELSIMVGVRKKYLINASYFPGFRENYHLYGRVRKWGSD